MFNNKLVVALALCAFVAVTANASLDIKSENGGMNGYANYNLGTISNSVSRTKSGPAIAQSIVQSSPLPKKIPALPAVPPQPKPTPAPAPVRPVPKPIGRAAPVPKRNFELEKLKGKAIKIESEPSTSYQECNEYQHIKNEISRLSAGKPSLTRPNELRKSQECENLTAVVQQGLEAVERYASSLDDLRNGASDESRLDVVANAAADLDQVLRLAEESDAFEQEFRHKVETDPRLEEHPHFEALLQRLRELATPNGDQNWKSMFEQQKDAVDQVLGVLNVVKESLPQLEEAESSLRELEGHDLNEYNEDANAHV